MTTTEPVVTGTTEPLRPGIGLCMSGGGFRAMIFHVGALWRLNEAGMLPEISRSSSVSGGSITNAVLAKAWPDLEFDDKGVAARFDDLVTEPLRKFASRTVDVWAGVTGLLIPGRIGARVALAYEKHLLGDMTLGDLPARGDGPTFTFCATDLRTGHLWFHERDRLGEYGAGFVPFPTYPVALAVAASSAFPPVLSPIVVDIERYGAVPAGWKRHHRLVDGGVYDNLGLQPVENKYEIVLASDAGSPFVDNDKPPMDWFRQLVYTTQVIDCEVRRLRRGSFVDGLERGSKGAFWGIGTNIADYTKGPGGLADPLDAPYEKTHELAVTPTRLARMKGKRQEQLINWGYAVADAALRRYVRPELPRGSFPYPKAGVG